MKSINLPLGVLAATVTLSIGMPHFAQGAESSAKDSMRPEQTTAVVDLTNGEIRKVDKDSKKITIKHGDIKNLDMPAMTMVFQVKDAAMLDTIQAGDKVKFKVEKLLGAYVVTELQLTK